LQPSSAGADRDRTVEAADTGLRPGSQREEPPRGEEPRTAGAKAPRRDQASNRGHFAEPRAGAQQVASRRSDVLGGAERDRTVDLLNAIQRPACTAPAHVGPTLAR